MQLIRNVLVSLFMTLLASSAAFAGPFLPIVFVHGDSDTAGLWMIQIWRFETNGYPRDRLFALDIPQPGARADMDVPEVNRSSPADAARALSDLVDSVLRSTGEDKVVLVANSRGCQTSRNYVRNFGGAAKVARMVLTGCVHNGVFVSEDEALGSEYNGAGRFLTALNAPPILPDGIPITIVRSDRFDLYSQPDGKFIGNPGKATGAAFDSPDLPGADNRVLEGVDHRETGYSPQSFAVMFEAITGRAPETTDIAAESAPVLSGKLSGFDNGAPTNLPIAGAGLSIYATDPATGARRGEAVFRQTLGSDGRWGPFSAGPRQTYEFEVSAPGLPIYHIYRSPFPRSTDIANIRLYPPIAGDGTAVSVMRPRGYFGPDDAATANGKPLPGIDPDEPVPHVWQARIEAPAGGSVVATFENERIAGIAPEGDAIAWIELSY